MRLSEELRRDLNKDLEELKKEDCLIYTELDGKEFSVNEIKYNEEIGIFYYVSETKESKNYEVLSPSLSKIVNEKTTELNLSITNANLFNFAIVHENLIDDILNDVIDLVECEIVIGAEVEDNTTVKLITKKVTSEKIKDMINDKEEYLK